MTYSLSSLFSNNRKSHLRDPAIKKFSRKKTDFLIFLIKLLSTFKSWMTIDL